MLYFLAIGALLALMKKRNPLTFLDQVSFRYPYILIAALGIQIGQAIFYYRLSNMYNYILEASMLLLMVGLVLNRHLKGIYWLLAGSFLNLLSLVIHDGRMPVTRSALRLSGLSAEADDFRHQLAEPGDVWVLIDWIPFFNKVMSLGDLAVGIGVILFVYHHSKQKDNRTS